MPVKKESLYPNDWFETAKKDIKRVNNNLKDTDYEDAAFHLQQAVEKYLKGYLLSHGWPLKRVHDLEYLLDETIKFQPELEEFRSLCQELTGYYFIERYPFFAEGPSQTDITSNLNKALLLIKKLETA